MLAWRRRGRRGLCLGLTGALHPSTAWSTLRLQASHMVSLQASHVVPLHHSSAASIHLELHSRLG
jgi:hypothetical protein